MLFSSVPSYLSDRVTRFSTLFHQKHSTCPIWTSKSGLAKFFVLACPYVAHIKSFKQKNKGGKSRDCMPFVFFSVNILELLTFIKLANTVYNKNLVANLKFWNVNNVTVDKQNYFVLLMGLIIFLDTRNS